MNNAIVTVNTESTASTTTQEYFTNILRYAYHNDISISLNEAKALLKADRLLSKERGYNVFNVTKKGMVGGDTLVELAEANGSIRSTKGSSELKKPSQLFFTVTFLEAVLNNHTDHTNHADVI